MTLKSFFSEYILILEKNSCHYGVFFMTRMSDSQATGPTALVAVGGGESKVSVIKFWNGGKLISVLGDVFKLMLAVEQTELGSSIDTGECVEVVKVCICGCCVCVDALLMLLMSAVVVDTVMHCS